MTEPTPSTPTTAGSALLAYRDDRFSAEVVDLDDQVELRWTDYVANEWRESYPALSVAVARFAALLHCAEHGWNREFSEPPEQFTRSVATFHWEVTTQ